MVVPASGPTPAYTNPLQPLPTVALDPAVPPAAALRAAHAPSRDRRAEAPRPQRPQPSTAPLPSLATRSGFLARFRPPFAFGDFFSPEDTVLCALATAWALRTHARAAAATRGRADASPGRGPRRVVELTCGSAMVALAQALARPRLRVWGADVDEAAVARARRNAEALGVGARARFRHLGLFDAGTAPWLARVRPDVVACNPPYIPEPPAQRLALVAGSGSDGAEHPRVACDVVAEAGVPRLTLSWCSMGDPVGVAEHAAARGWTLERLWVAAIADGEWSGLAYDHARTLPTAFLSERPDDLAALAPDGDARFAYLLLCASFARADAPGAPAGDAARRAGVDLVARTIDAFVRDGLRGVADVGVADVAARRDGPRVRAYACDRWDELVLRGLAHGAATDD